MRHRVAQATSDPTAAATRRPGRRIRLALMAAIAGAHLWLLTSPWNPATPHAAGGNARMSMRLVSVKVPALSSTPGRAMEPVATPSVRSATSTRAPRANKALPERRPPEATRVEPTNAPVVGIAFGMPRIGLPGVTDPRPIATSPNAPIQVQAPPLAAPAAMFMQAAWQAGQSQLADALQRELMSLQTPANEDSRSCTLFAGEDTEPACDSDALRQAIQPREAALVGLLRAYRSMAPQVQGLSIAVEHGRYRASWTSP